MNHNEASRFEFLFQRYLNELTLKGKQPKTIEDYALSVRHAAKFFDCCPKHLSVDQLKAFFQHLLQKRSWSKVKIARNGSQNFYRLVLQREWSGSILSISTDLSCPLWVERQRANKCLGDFCGDSPIQNGLFNLCIKSRLRATCPCLLSRCKIDL